MTEAIDRFFEGKPGTRAIFDEIKRRIDAAAPNQIEVGSQISFGSERKFAWVWLYNVSQRNPDGILHLSLRLDHEVEDERIRDVTQVSNNRWNHQIVVRSLDEARAGWLGDLIDDAASLGGANRSG